MILDMVLDVSFKICIAFAVLAFADWFYQKKKFSNDMKMTETGSQRMSIKTQREILRSKVLSVERCRRRPDAG